MQSNCSISARFSSYQCCHPERSEGSRILRRLGCSSIMISSNEHSSPLVHTILARGKQPIVSGAETLIERQIGDMNIESVKLKLEKQLLKLPNVIGVGIGKKAGKMIIKVLTNGQLPRSLAKQAIPKSLDGYEIVQEDIGDVKPLPRE
jgi:hypothetical protein